MATISYLNWCVTNLRVLLRYSHKNRRLVVFVAPRTFTVNSLLYIPIVIHDLSNLNISLVHSAKFACGDFNQLNHNRRWTSGLTRSSADVNDGNIVDDNYVHSIDMYWVAIFCEGRINLKEIDKFDVLLTRHIYSMKAFQLCSL